MVASSILVAVRLKTFLNGTNYEQNEFSYYRLMALPVFQLSSFFLYSSFSDFLFSHNIFPISCVVF